MLIKDLINKYIENGHNVRNAQNLAAEEIVIRKIASSPLLKHVTLKGGIVMFNLTKNNRRVTQDIDFDLIRYSIEEESIHTFVNKLNTIDDGITASIAKSLEKLHQEDYQGVRVHLLLEDLDKTKLRIKLDIGVHTYSSVEQEAISFSFNSGEDSISLKVNSCEQIFAEKLLSLGRLGPISTRYKDIYDFYYLIDNNLLKQQKIIAILNLFFSSKKRKPESMNELVNSVVDTLNNENFLKEATLTESKWIDVDDYTLKETIINYIKKF